MVTSIVRVRQLLLLVGDLVCFVLGLFIALIIRYGLPLSSEVLSTHTFPFAIIFAFWFFCFYIGGVYNLRKIKNPRDFFTLLFTAFAVNAGVSVLFFYFIPYFAITPKRVLFLDLGFTLILLTAWRAFHNKFVSLPPRNIAILGSSPEVQQLVSDINSHPQQGYRCALHIQDERNMHNLPHMFKAKDIDIVVVAANYRSSKELQYQLFACIPLQIQFFDFVDFYEEYFQKIPLATIDRAWFLENLNESGKQMFSMLKRMADLVLAILLGVVGLVLFPFVALAILLDSGRPIFYSQIRVGQFERPFRIYKFRTMKIISTGEKRVTGIGRFLRATHLDEIPQLFNVIAGNMSFVGPRPEITHFVQELKIKIPFYTERLLVRPGITGWAQLHEPRAKAEDAMGKLQYDLFYIKHRSFVLDLEIVLKTLRILVL